MTIKNAPNMLNRYYTQNFTMTKGWSVNRKLRVATCDPAVKIVPNKAIAVGYMSKRNPGLITNKAPKNAKIKIVIFLKSIFSPKNILARSIIKNGLNCLMVIASVKIITVMV